MGLGGPLGVVLLQFLPGVVVAFGPYGPDVIAAKFPLPFRYMVLPCFFFFKNGHGGHPHQNYIQRCDRPHINNHIDNLVFRENKKILQ